VIVYTMRQSSQQIFLQNPETEEADLNKKYPYFQNSGFFRRLESHAMK